VVDDINATYKDLRQKGVQFKSPPCKVTDKNNPMFGAQLVYFWGPEGMTLELFQGPK